MGLPKLPPNLLELLQGSALTPAPEVLLRLMRAVEDEGASLADIAGIVDKDPAIAARILTAANSPVFRRSRSFVSIEDSLQVLGLRVVRSIAICLSVQCAFASRQDEIDFGGFWRHSLMTAELAREIALAIAYPRPGEAYLGGLLHDIGELALLSALRERYAELLSNSADEVVLCQLEYSTLSATHAEVGAWLVDQWQLDSTLADGVLFHHATSTQIAEADVLARIVWLANACAEGGPRYETLLKAPGALLDGKTPDLAAMRERIDERVALIAEAMGMPVHPDGLLGASCMPQAKFAAISKKPGATNALIESVAETALLQSLQSELQAPGRPGEVVIALREAMRILFGAEQSTFLLYDSASKFLSGAGIEMQLPAFQQVRLPLEGSSSLAVAAFNEKKPRGNLVDGESRTGAPVSLADLQFCRALDTDALLCLPMYVGNLGVGVIVLGVSLGAQKRMSESLSWLQGFARIAATALEGLPRPEAAEGRQVSGQIRRFTHEVGNPLGIIKSYLKLLDRKLPEDSQVHDELSVLKEEIERVVRIVQQLSEPEAASRGPVSLNATVQAMMTLYGDALFKARGIEIRLRLDAADPKLECDEDALRQILLNLFKNASEAMSEGGHIEVGTVAASMHEGQLYARVSVRDNGPGMPVHIMQRLYVPPQNTTAGRRGMGLGIVGGLVRQMGARILCEARSGEGTCIDILLPLEASESLNQTNLNGGRG